MWKKIKDADIIKDKDYLVKFPTGVGVARLSKGHAFSYRSGEYLWRDGDYVYPDCFIVAVMEIPEFETENPENREVAESSFYY